MRYFFLWLPIVFVCSCNFQQKTSEPIQSDSETDSLIYEELITGFEKRFAEIEKEYEVAGEDREAELDLVYEKLELELVEAQKNFIKAYPNSSLCLPILWEIDWSFNSAFEYKSYLDMIEASDCDPEDFARLAAIVKRMEQVEIGSFAPDFEMEDAEGNLVRLSDTYSGAKYVLLDFWASTCGPCRKENLIIRRAYDLYQNQGFEVLGVSTDVRKDAWIDAVEKDGLIWTNLCSLQKWGENEVVKTYALRQVSQNFLLDSNGKILATNLRGDELLNTLNDLLN